jgi:predicted membrane protein
MRWAVSADAAEGSGFRVKGLRFKGFGIIVRVQGLGFGIQSYGFRV